MSNPRCARQRLLPEVGPAGQARLAAEPARLTSGMGSEVAREYLERAGVREVLSSDGPADPFPHASHLRHAAPRAVGAGSWTALSHVRRVLGLI